MRFFLDDYGLIRPEGRWAPSCPINVGVVMQYMFIGGEHADRNKKAAENNQKSSHA